MTYLTTAKFLRLENALRSTRDIEGDLVEFGVALGGSAIVIASRSQGRPFHGFDVFGMIPEPASDKDDEHSKSRYEVIKSGKSAGIDGQEYYGYRNDLYSDVVVSFARHGLTVGEANIRLYKGLFEDSWPTAKIDKLAFVHLDCDWYDPVTYCLKAVAGKMSPGGIILIDDYHDYAGCKTAVDEFISQNPDYVFEDGPNPMLRYAG
ncbi:MAG: TylF/MycF/NovP-related O-methyltransferase [Parasphingorhabdus sp.]|uniref:TylF/MycF/NovP-related O-methyltransferase n=1 Tax=Parasphingorhabdus sp. TaxID=2709688 RepID=UPI00326403F7